MVHTLQRDGHVLSFCNLGATWRSWELPSGRDILLGFEWEEDYAAQDFYCGAVVGRVANRIRNAQFPLFGESIQLAANEGSNQLHGGPVGFDKLVWEAETIESDGAPAIRFRTTSPDGDQGYPGTLRMETLYRLDTDGLVEIRFTATTDAPTLCNPTHHAYFNLAGKGKVHEHLVQLEADHFLPSDDSSLPTGEVLSVAGTALDLRRPQVLGEVLASGDAHLHGVPCLDHCFVARGEPGQLRPIARIQAGDVGLDVAASAPGFHFYTGHFIPTKPLGRGGRHFGPSAGLAIEPAHFPDSANHPQFPRPLLLPGETFYSGITFRCHGA